MKRTAPKALYQGLAPRGQGVRRQGPSILGRPVAHRGDSSEVFAGWFRNFIDVRDEEGAERCLITAIELGISRQDIADMISPPPLTTYTWTAWHVVDFANKAFELLDHLGGRWRGRCSPAWYTGWPGPAEARNSAHGDTPSTSLQWSGKRGRSFRCCSSKAEPAPAAGMTPTPWQLGCWEIRRLNP